MLVSSQDAEARKALFDFLHAHGVKLAWSDDFQAIGRLGADRRLLGVVGYNGFNGKTCAMHMAGEGNWINRELLRAAFAYPFQQLGLLLVFGTVAGTNEKALRLDMHLGFEVALRVPNGWDDGVDLWILTMKRENCRHLAGRVKYERKAA